VRRSKDRFGEAAMQRWPPWRMSRRAESDSNALLGSVAGRTASDPAPVRQQQLCTAYNRRTMLRSQVMAAS